MTNTKELLLKKYADNFCYGDINPKNYRESAEFIRGLYASFVCLGKIDINDSIATSFERTINTLYGGANFIEYCERHNITEEG